MSFCFAPSSPSTFFSTAAIRAKVTGECPEGVSGGLDVGNGGRRGAAGGATKGWLGLRCGLPCIIAAFAGKAGPI